MTIVAVVAAVAVIGAGYLLTDRNIDGQSATVDRAAQVMPFDLDATRHTFTKTAQGGVEQVLALDPDDARNAELIRSHVELEAGKFRNGDFGDPTEIHGMDMPGVSELEAGVARLDVDYESVPGGARITYFSTDPTLVDALHAWFDAQTSDHSMPGMGG